MFSNVHIGCLKNLGEFLIKGIIGRERELPMPNHENRYNWIHNLAFLSLLTCLSIHTSSIASESCKGIAVTDNSKFESNLPFKEPTVPPNYDGYLSYLTVIDENGNPIEDFNQETTRKRLINTSKRKCVPKVVTYPDVRLTLTSYKDGKPHISKEFENNAKVAKKMNYYEPPGTLSAIIPFNDKIIHGKVQYLHSDGTLNYIQQFQNDKREGCFEMKFLKGKIAQKGCYVNDKLDGQFVEYFENGVVKLEAQFKNGILNGKISENYESGKPKLRAYYKNGKTDGIYSETFSNGKPMTKARYAEGMIVGTANVYFDDGTISEEYISGTKEAPGHYNRFYKGQKTLASVQVINNKYDGPYNEFNEKGIKVASGTYKDGILEGPFRMFYNNGTLKSEVKYENGKEVFYEDYYTHGGLQTKAIYGKRNELLKIQVFDSYGAIDIQYPIKNGNIDGEVVKFYRNGTVAERTKYIDGKSTNVVSGFYPTGAKQYLAYLTDNGQLIGGAFFDPTGKKLKYFKNYKDGIISQMEYYDDGSVKSGSFIQQDGSEQRIYYLPYNTEKTAMDQVFKKDIGLTFIQMSFASNNVLCLWEEDKKNYLCGSKDLTTGQTQILDSNSVMTSLREYAESNAFEKVQLDDLVNPDSPTSLFSIANSKLISASIVLNEKKQRCYNLGFTEHCE
jgi:antitoxin component YwqK of YwqJK toxin-antitoxin module